jgi:putative methionine-R-sulfoxide reductase with GAF domain
MDSPAAKPAESVQTWNPALGDRRRRVRQKAHAPAYASLDTNSSGMLLDLNEVVDISEEGMAIQTAAPPEPNTSLNLSLDLSETKSYIHTTGEVVWADRSGRVGIRFPNMPYASVRQLKEWLFLNAITACSNHMAAQGLHLRSVTSRAEVFGTSPIENPDAPTSPDYTEMLGALGAVQREAEAFGPNLEAALQLVVERAETFTRATGAAIALKQDDLMVCRASAGDAPPVGAVLQIGSGFSGECVRAGRLLRCDDTETDPRVDRESCRALGIRSMIAIPIHAQGGIAGLLEIFSPKPQAFGDNDNIVIRRLAETTASAVRRSHSAASAATAADSRFSPEAGQEMSAESRSAWFRPLLLGMAFLVVAAVAAWLLLPWLKSKTNPPAQPPAAVKPQAVAKPANLAGVTDLDSMRNLAEQGDPAAQFALGAHYVTGEGVTQNYNEAVHWFSLAAAQGHVIAQSTLGAYYGIGRGAPQDYAKAYFWSLLAQAGGDDASKYRIPLLVSHLTRAQVLVIQQQANEWLRQHQMAATKPSPAQ